MTGEDRIEAAIRKGDDAFWAAVAAQFPEATTGILAPDAAVALSQEMGRAVRAWVDSNVTVDSAAG